nr:PREDICTED: cubilin isoform X2 [Bemisia tabaci]
MAQDNRCSSGRSLAVLLSLCFFQFQSAFSGAGEEPLVDSALRPKCDSQFVSVAGGPTNGTFTAPVFENSGGQSVQCVYTFVAAPNQRVEVVFTAFNLRGTPPECIHEYLDVYSEVLQAEAKDLVNSPFGGRYCGDIAPRRRISLYRSVALSFHTDKNFTTADLFAGRYTFFNDTEYQIGNLTGSSPCSFEIHAEAKRQGTIISPTYPGVYPKDLYCSYLFLGKKGQRIRLEFRDFDLFYGGPHCPFDVVKIYDGRTNDSAIIGTYCGQQRNLYIYSSDNEVLVTFETLQRTANTQNRGFKGIFEFSESFVKLDFIVKNDGEHIRGTECDQKILSKKGSNGFVYSPNYPYPYHPKIVCRYFIYGMQDSQNLERVHLEFSLFDIPKGDKGDCSDGYLKIYLKGQETTDSYDKFDHELCGEDTKTSSVVSDGPRLVMIFSSGELQGRGFKAQYIFETEYRVPGTAAPDGSCAFSYQSASKKRGEFNSPRFPGNYPSSTNCTYTFITSINEQVVIIFEQFKVRADSANTSVAQYGFDNCHEDWVEISNLYRDGGVHLIGRYCGATSPGPIESSLGAVGLRIFLRTDAEGVYSGFKARYAFEPAKPMFGDCGQNLSSSDYGVITSPNFPTKYSGPQKGGSRSVCSWFITVRPNHRILLNFDFFFIEGDPPTRGCSAAVIRLWHTLSGLPLEFCGEKPPKDNWQYLSDGNVMKLSFVVADKSVGGEGFRAVWTEVAVAPKTCSEFKCAKNSYCIADNLRCNSVANCGADDSSDEANCYVETPVDWLLISVLGGAGISAIIMLMLCVCCQRKHRHRQRRHHLTRLHSASPGSLRSLAGQQHYCDEIGQRYASVNSV